MKTADELYIGIDNGTQGTKCAVYSRNKGRLLASASAPHALDADESGRREQHPDDWIEAATSTLDACLSDPAVDRASVVGIGVSGQQHGMVALDRDNRPIRPAKLWCDTETVDECNAITKAMGGAKAVIAAIGNAVAVGFTASKVLWMLRHEPENAEKLDAVLLPHDYLNLWLTGNRVTECGDASGTAYFDVRNRNWSEPLLRVIDPSGRLRACLPPVIEADAPAGVLRPALAERFGLPSKVIVSAGGGDNMMAAIGTGNVVPGVVTMSLGTSGTIYAYSDKPVIDPAGDLAAFCSSSGGWLPLICTMNVTVATECTRSLLGLDVKAFDAAVERAPVGAGGLLWLPYFNGERTPPLPLARAVLGGQSSTNLTPENVCRAAMEGATLGLRYGMDIMRRQGVTAGEIVLVGGGANSRVWRGMVADLFDCPVICPESKEAGVMGCVLQTMWCRERTRDSAASIADLASQLLRMDPSARAEPDAGRARAYDDIYARYLDLNNSLTPLFCVRH